MPKYLSYNDLAELFRVDHATVRRWANGKKPDFPAPIRLSGKTVVFDADEIDQWVEGRKDKRKKNAGN